MSNEKTEDQTTGLIRHLIDRHYEYKEKKLPCKHTWKVIATNNYTNPKTGCVKATGYIVQCEKCGEIDERRFYV